MELRRETKSIGSNEKYFHPVATPNREKPKEEEEEEEEEKEGRESFANDFIERVTFLGRDSNLFLPGYLSCCH